MRTRVTTFLLNSAFRLKFYKSKLARALIASATFKTFVTGNSGSPAGGGMCLLQIGSQNMVACNPPEDGFRPLVP